MIASIVICLFLCGATLAADYYVSSSRSHGNPGTLASPFRTIRNCIIRNTDGPAIIISGLGHRIENCLFERIDWSAAHGASFTIGGKVDDAPREDLDDPIERTGDLPVFRSTR